MDIAPSSVGHNELHFDIDIGFEWFESLVVFEFKPIDLGSEVIAPGIDRFALLPTFIYPPDVIMINRRGVAELQNEDVVIPPVDWLKRCWYLIQQLSPTIGLISSGA